ncbi:ABC transporter ATP-binding protein [Cryptosporangium aurantiacum]|uniref:ABC-2 type transport system ATP-binding protein n=1 Tax=Cryptosporangium aurantiacum TaxID=134849 RepID=A0A1M7RNS8_9ACTN|nr:ABC transporter ATP-binding protein [Cryptosporangium aurantiacum]SHN47756.1 ABC-2 type transport system ATP-binding protein [Cryptosporangium aurantiacum]
MATIEIRGLTKRFGARTAVDDLTFTVRPGQVTGFLGPNGAGKTTTMRVILGLDAPTAGTATVDGHRYRDLPQPMRTMGALLDARAVHPSRTARSHLRCLARSNGLPDARVDEVLADVGLTDVAGQRAGRFSLGMSQRLGIAAALLGDPAVLMFDEPVNGLDTEGIRWIRALMRRLAAEGRTVLVSSHLMSEMALTADHLVVVGRGRLLADCPLPDVLTQGDRTVLVRTPTPSDLIARLSADGVTIRSDAAGELLVTGLDSEDIGHIAAAAGIVLTELTPQRASLEDAFTALTSDSVEFAGAGSES